MDAKNQAWVERREAATKARLAEILVELSKVTEGCGTDMHEPDGEGLKGSVVGTKLDNACGASIQERAIIGGHQEIVVVLNRFYEGKTGAEAFMDYQINLCDLIALARKAVL